MTFEKEWEPSRPCNGDRTSTPIWLGLVHGISCSNLSYQQNQSAMNIHITASSSSFLMLDKMTSSLMTTKHNKALSYCHKDSRSSVNSIHPARERFFGATGHDGRTNNGDGQILTVVDKHILCQSLGIGVCVWPAL